MTGCTSCPTAARLRREVEDLKAEVAEWERRGPEGEASDDHENRVATVRIKLGLRPQAARVLLLLLARPGRLTSAVFLAEALGWPEDRTRNLTSVYLTMIRNALRDCGAPGRIETAWGQGWRMSPADVAMMETWLFGGGE